MVFEIIDHYKTTQVDNRRKETIKYVMEIFYNGLIGYITYNEFMESDGIKWETQTPDDWSMIRSTADIWFHQNVNLFREL